jgi:CRP-like cAMP-binding protein
MRSSSSPRSRNHLLSALSAADFALVQPDLKAIVFPLRHVFESPNRPIRQVFFLEEGLGSVVVRGPRDKQIEAGIVGREGMSGIPVILRSERSPNAMYMQVAGHGQSLAVGPLRAAMAKSASMTALLLRFAQAFLTQTTHTALANGRATIEQRLARWLLMAQDRVDGNILPLTHEFLALMLGVRRSGVTVALNLLEARGLIRVQRGRLLILDRRGLEKLANGIYGIPEDEYGRLIGWSPAPWKSGRHAS